MQLPQTLDSPLSGLRAGARLVRSLPAAPIIKSYKEQFGYDAAPYFDGIPEAGLYRCVETDFSFYYPFTLCGKESLYRSLEKFEWNYKEDKWEHQEALGYVRPGDKVLDVGCGQGSFLHKAMVLKGSTSTGLELNRSAAAKAQARGIEVCSELIDAHDRRDYYDVVTSFQVLEHVTAPRVFVEGCLRALKPDGLCILGVPNNDGFLGMEEGNVLNGPPHHMALWNRRSLSALASIFPIEVQAIEVEPLAEIDWYQSVMERRYLPRRWQRTLYHRLGGARLFRSFISDNAHTIAGHSILAIYRKK